MLKLVTPSASGELDAKAFRAALSRFASGVTVVTTVDANGAIHGMTATAFSSLSLEPPLVLVAVGHNSRCHRQIVATRRFGVSVLGEEQIALSRHFGKSGAADVQPTFERLAEQPVLGGALVALACELHDTAEGGDHTIFVGRVAATHHAGAGRPLIHFEGHYRSLSKDKL